MIEDHTRSRCSLSTGYVKRLHAEMSRGSAQSGTHASAGSSSLAQSVGDTDEDDDLYSFLNTDNSETTDEESTLLQQVLVQCFVYCRPTMFSK